MCVCVYVLERTKAFAIAHTLAISTITNLRKSRVPRLKIKLILVASGFLFFFPLL